MCWLPLGCLVGAAAAVATAAAFVPLGLFAPLLDSLQRAPPPRCSYLSWRSFFGDVRSVVYYLENNTVE